ncbi:MAG: DUF2752 domain-containing protein [Planctomycetes bacterium]|nr:DUF2752 domain-containing protein [Planctomycetota bacterium]
MGTSASNRVLGYLSRRPSAVLSILAGGAVLTSCVFSPGGLPNLPVCWFKNTTGLPCPGCGLTRAFCAISHGDFGAAWSFNPFGFLFYAGAVALAVWPVLVWKFPRLENVRPAARRVVWFVFGLIAAMWVFGVWRICAGSNV